jgi:hypothetical protein
MSTGWPAEGRFGWIELTPTALLALLLFLALLGGGAFAPITLAGIGLGLGLLLCAQYAGERLPGLNWKHGGRFLLAVGVLTTFAWAWLFDSAQYSDFGIYYRCGAQNGSAFPNWLEICQSGYLRRNLIFWSRSLLYTTPLFALGSESYSSLKLLNAVLQSAGLAAIYGFACAMGSPKFGFWALLLYLVNPERWFSVTLATSDHVALLLVLGLLAMFQANARCAWPPWQAMAVGVMAWLLDITRSVGPVVLCAFVAWVALGAVGSKTMLMRTKVFFFATAAYVVAAVLWTAALRSWNVEAIIPGEPLGLLRHLSGLDFRSEQLFPTNYPWVEHAWHSVPRELRAEVALARIWTEVTQGIWEWPSYFVRKAQIFFSGDGYYGFAAYNHVPPGIDSEMTVPRSSVPFSPQLAAWMRATQVALVVLAFWACLGGAVLLISSGLVFAIVWTVVLKFRHAIAF